MKCNGLRSLSFFSAVSGGYHGVFRAKAVGAGGHTMICATQLWSWHWRRGTSNLGRKRRSNYFLSVVRPSVWLVCWLVCFSVSRLHVHNTATLVLFRRLYTLARMCRLLLMIPFLWFAVLSSATQCYFQDGSKMAPQFLPCNVSAPAASGACCSKLTFFHPHPFPPPYKITTLAFTYDFIFRHRTRREC